MEDFTQNRVDEGVSASKDTLASTSRGSGQEMSRKAVSVKLSIFKHFPKEQNCEVRKRTTIARAHCRKRTGDTVLGAENFGDLITADLEVPSEESESRTNHRYALVVQDLATQWIQSYPCKTKTSQETEKNLRKFLEPTEKPKVIKSDNSLEF